jgi:hypothetical protein
MKKKVWRVLLGIFIASAVLVVGYTGVWIWAAGYPVIDPAPRGEGSYEELDNVFQQFRTFYHTGSIADLPTGYVRLTGFESEEPDAKETWMVYYATASHSFRRGGTIVLMGSDGRIDGYFGHQCSKRDGGTVMVVPKEPSYWSGGTYFCGLEGVRQVFGKTFKHQRTEQAVSGNRR